MKKFKHINASSVAEASLVLKDNPGQARIIAGGTDLLGQMKDAILSEPPEVIVNIKSIPGLDYIKTAGRTVKIGALTRLEDIARNAAIRKSLPILAEAAAQTASPHIREQGTIAGNICQSNRCWYYWVAGNLFNCMRKGGRTCYAAIGDNRYHSIFGGSRVGVTPCAADCLSGIDIPAYLAKFRAGDKAAAAQILLEANPMPAVTGRVCPHPCESGCNRGQLDEPVSIRAIEREVGDYILDNADNLMKAPPAKNKKKVAVVGSGPAGLAAAFYLMRKGYQITVFESRKEAGGMLFYGIPPYRLPKDVVRRQIAALEKSGIAIKTGVEIGKGLQLVDLAKDFAAVFVASGSWKERASGIKGDAFLLSGTKFLRDVNIGEGKAPGKKVAVIGGGNVAIDVARTLLRLGSQPTIIYRRTLAEMPAVREEVERAEQEGIAFEFLTLPVQAAKKGRKVALACTRMKLGEVDESGRPRPVAIAGSEFTIEYDAVIKALGEESDTSIVPPEFVDRNGRLKVDDTGKFKSRNIFAGGDFVTGPSTVAGAMAHGRKVAAAIDLFLGGRPGKTDNTAENETTTFNPDFLKPTARAESPELSVKDRVMSIRQEDVGGLGEKVALRESNRCLNCGCVAVNSSDMAPVLMALGAQVKTSKRVIDIASFFAIGVNETTVLDNDEIVTEIDIPKPGAGVKGAFLKFAIRKSIDFPIVNCAALISIEGGKVSSARICLNSVATIPYRAAQAEKYLVGKTITAAVADKAGVEAVADSWVLSDSRYKVQIAKTLVKRAVLACKHNGRGSPSETRHRDCHA
jgi:NADPH-dependent glutamate synthase beta subunit-like oxidoreductase/CO/xanthine dehydrogenase FAD-binding subunit